MHNWSSCLIENNLELNPSPPNCSIDSWKLLSFFIYIKWLSLVTNKLFKSYIQKCTLPYELILIMTSDLVNHGMVKNTKALISWEWNKNYLQNKKTLNLCIIWLILRSYRLVAKVTFKFKDSIWAKLKSGQPKAKKSIINWNFL